MKSICTGMTCSSHSACGERETLPACSKVLWWAPSWNDWKKINSNCQHSTHRDMSLHSKWKLRRSSALSPTWTIHWICGWRFKSYGHLLSPSSLVVILLVKCPFKPNSSRVLIKTGWKSWRKQSRPKKLLPVAKTICWRISCRTWTENWRIVKRCLKLILRVRERSSLVSTSYRIRHCWRFSPKVLSRPPSKRTLRNSSMPSRKWHLRLQKTRRIPRWSKSLLFTRSLDVTRSPFLWPDIPWSAKETSKIG